MKGRTFSGCLYAADVSDDGTLTSKWRRFGEAYPLALKITQEIVKIRGRTCVTNGNIIGTKSKPADAGGSLTLFDYTAQNIADALRGIVTTRAVSTSTLTAEAVTLGKFGEFVEIGTEDLSNISVQDETDTTDYDINADYLLDTVLGLISPVSSGAISEDDVVHISGDGGANTDERVTIGTGSSKKIAIKGNLTDDFDGTTCKLHLRKVLITSSNEVNFLSDEGTEREQLDFELAPEIPSGQVDYGTIDGLPI